MQPRASLRKFLGNTQFLKTAVIRLGRFSSPTPNPCPSGRIHSSGPAFFAGSKGDRYISNSKHAFDLFSQRFFLLALIPLLLLLLLLLLLVSSIEVRIFPVQRMQFAVVNMQSSFVNMLLRW